MAAVGLIAVGTGAFLVGGASAPAVRVQGANRPIDPGASDARDIRANNSPTVLRNPTDPVNVVTVNRIDTPRFSCALHVSRDGGRRWTDVAVPFPAGEEDPPRCFGPDASFGPDGTLYVSFVTLKGVANVPSGTWVVSSSDGGDTFSAPVRAVGPFGFQVRVAADPARAERLYLTWVQTDEVAVLGFARPGNPILLARSDDGGVTWGEPVRVSTPARSRVLAPELAVGRDGRLYVAYLDVKEDSLDYHGAHQGKGGEPYPGTWALVLARSSDAGASWRETVVEASLVPTQRFVAFFPPTPSLGLDPAGRRVYVAFADGRLNDADVRIWRSNDGGARFGGSMRVNDTPRGDGTTQHLPRVAVAPDGRVDVMYYDRRADRRDQMTEVSLQVSTDGGRSFSRRLVLSDRAFDSRIGFGSERGMPDLGSRLGLSSTNEQALAAWADTRAGTEASNKQDLATAVVSFEGIPGWRKVLGGTGLLVTATGLLAGVATLAGTVRSRRAGKSR